MIYNVGRLSPVVLVVMHAPIFRLQDWRAACQSKYLGGGTIVPEIWWYLLLNVIKHNVGRAALRRRYDSVYQTLLSARHTFLPIPSSYFLASVRLDNAKQDIHAQVSDENRWT